MKKPFQNHEKYVQKIHEVFTTVYVDMVVRNTMSTPFNLHLAVTFAVGTGFLRARILRDPLFLITNRRLGDLILTRKFVDFES